MMKRWMLAAALLLALTGVAAAQPAFTPAQRAEIVEIVRNALRTDPTILRDAVAALQQDDTARQESASRAAIAGLGAALTATPGDPVAGNPKGDVTLVEFYDIRCPYCRRMQPVMADLLRQDPRLRVVFKDIPILGPGSVLGARAVLAAQNQGGYLKLRDALMAGPATIDLDVIKSAAEQTGLDWERLRKDMESPEVQARITANLALARKLNIEGTPAYVIGGRLLPGAMELAELKDVVAAARKN